MSKVIQPSMFGMLSATVTNTFGMINNAAIAGERITSIAADKASNLAEISRVQGTLKMVEVRKDLKDACEQAGVTINADGTMSFG